MSTPLRIAILEAAHWHVPLYLPALRRDDVRIVAVSDSYQLAGPRLAAQVNCSSYASYRTLLEREAVDFAFVFGRHGEMPAIASDLIDCGLPFTIEKPCGTRAEDVRLLRERAESRKLYVAVPFILRLPAPMEAVRSAIGPVMTKFQHMDLRLVAGPLSRYQESENAWMLDETVAGGGCTINLATHL